MRAKRLISRMVLAAVVVGVLAPAAMAADKPILDRYLDKYWGKTRDVEVVEKRLYEKSGRHEFGLFFGMIPNDEFLLYYPLGVRYDFFIVDSFAVELFGTYVLSNKSDLAGFLSDETDGFGIDVDSGIPEIIEWNAGLAGVWSPLHGKIGIFTEKLFHFDWHLAAGVAGLGTSVRPKLTEGDRTSRTAFGGLIGTGLRIYVAEQGALNLNYRNFIYTRDDGVMAFPAELTFGAAFFTK